MILLDEPRWPAHGRLWGHLVSDTDLTELHSFAAAAGLPFDGFDHDHYDYPAELQARLLELGAHLFPSGVLLRRLRQGGLRVRPQDRAPKRPLAAARLQERWAALAPLHPQVGEDLIARWSQEHRRYHDVRHLAHALDALDELGGAEPVVTWALWFHDAVHTGHPSRDERDSAALAASTLAPVLPAADVAEVVRLIGVTVDHAPAAGDARGGVLSDADLSILGAVRGRYDVYARDVRAEYRHVPDDAFRAGRSAVLRGLLSHDSLFSTAAGRQRWEHAARRNLSTELDRLMRPAAVTRGLQEPR